VALDQSLQSVSSLVKKVDLQADPLIESLNKTASSARMVVIGNAILPNSGEVKFPTTSW
jgi:hypothetical protein